MSRCKNFVDILVLLLLSDAVYILVSFIINFVTFVELCFCDVCLYDETHFSKVFNGLIVIYFFTVIYEFDPIFLLNFTCLNDCCHNMYMQGVRDESDCFIGNYNI